jgi:hypothetical protein
MHRWRLLVIRGEGGIMGIYILFNNFVDNQYFILKKLNNYIYHNIV